MIERLVSTAEKHVRTSGATEFPVINGIPILSTAYFKSFNELRGTALQKKSRRPGACHRPYRLF